MTPGRGRARHGKGVGSSLLVGDFKRHSRVREPVPVVFAILSDYDDDYIAGKTCCEKCLLIQPLFRPRWLIELAKSVDSRVTSSTFLESRQIQISIIARPPMQPLHTLLNTGEYPACQAHEWRLNASWRIRSARLNQKYTDWPRVDSTLRPIVCHTRRTERGVEFYRSAQKRRPLPVE